MTPRPASPDLVRVDLVSASTRQRESFTAKERAGEGPARGRWASGVASFLGVAALLLTASSASARPGTHPVVVSTWDARASSVVLQYRRGLLDGGGFNIVSYNANFSATSGKLSSQFGLHYLNFSEASQPTAHGLSATAAAVFNFPLTDRFDNGLPKVALGLVLGSAPTALISGERNFISVPLVLGLAAPVTPAKAVTLTPWIEFAPSVNLDTIIKPYDLTTENWQDYVNIQTGEIKLTAEDVQRVVSKSVELDTSVAVGARGGLDVALHASDAFDFVANATLSSVGTAFSGARVWYLGGGFAWRWDHIVPAVLPAERRLLTESCENIEQRFRACPNSRRWRTPEELPASPVPGPVMGQTAPDSPVQPAPIPATPAPPSVPQPTDSRAVPPPMTGNAGDAGTPSGAAPTSGTQTPTQSPTPNTSTTTPASPSAGTLPELPPLQSAPARTDGANP